TASMSTSSVQSLTRQASAHGQKRSRNITRQSYPKFRWAVLAMWKKILAASLSSWQVKIHDTLQARRLWSTADPFNFGKPQEGLRWKKRIFFSSLTQSNN